MFMCVNTFVLVQDLLSLYDADLLKQLSSVPWNVPQCAFG